MTSTVLFHKLLHLAMEMDEEGIRDANLIRTLLQREAMTYREIDSAFHIPFQGHVVRLQKGDINTNDIWQLLDNAMDTSIG